MTTRTLKKGMCVLWVVVLSETTYGNELKYRKLWSKNRRTGEKISEIK